MKYKRIQFKNMAVDEDEGVFEGYGSVFDVLDSDGDIVEPGAFAKSLAVGSAKDGVPILAQHDDKMLPLGKSLSLWEDEHGLKMKGYISPTSLGRDYRQLVRDGVIKEASIGYREIDAEIDENGVRHLKEVDLLEISLVTFPANKEAVITGYKSKQGGKPMDSFSEMTVEELNELAAVLTAEISARSQDKGAKDEAVPVGEEKPDEKEDDPTKTGVKTSVKSADATPISRKYADIFVPTRSATTREDAERLPQGIGFARSLKCMMLGGGDPDRAASYAKKNYGDARLVRELKALSVTSPTAGGFFVPETYASEVIPLLKAKAIVRKLGATVLPMDSGNMTMPKMTGGTTAGYVGELRPGKKTEAKVGAVKLSAKKLMALIPISNDLLRSNSYSADQIILQDVTDELALQQDRAALMGKGNEFEPKGLFNTAGVEKLDLGPADLSTLGKMRAALIKKNAKIDRLGWAINADSWEAFYNVSNALGVFPLRDGMDNEKLLGRPFEISTQIPNTKSGAAQIILGNWSDLLIGEQVQMEAKMFEEGSYQSPDGNVVSAMETDSTVLRVISLHDMAVRYAESFVIGEITL